MQRPDTFTLNMSHPLAKGLEVASLVPFRDSTQPVYQLSPNTGVTKSKEIQRSISVHPGSASGIALNRPTPLGTEYTVAAWVNLRTGMTVDGGIAGCTTGTTRQFWLDVQYTPTRWRLGAQAGNVVYGTTESDFTGSWIHAAFVLSGTTLTFYLNGIQDGTGVISGDTSIEFIAASTSITVKQLDGKFADCLIYRRPVSASEISDIADPSNVMLSGLISYPRRKWWPVSSGATFQPAWAFNATQVAV